jgi:hypothetical protein
VLKIVEIFNQQIDKILLVQQLMNKKIKTVYQYNFFWCTAIAFTITTKPSIPIAKEY